MNKLIEVTRVAGLRDFDTYLLKTLVNIDQIASLQEKEDGGCYLKIIDEPCHFHIKESYADVSAKIKEMMSSEEPLPSQPTHRASKE